jgi:hypothetical protein
VKDQVSLFCLATATSSLLCTCHEMIAAGMLV